MLQKYLLILSSLIYHLGSVRGFHPIPCPLQQLFVSCPTAPGLIVFLTQCEFSSWYVQFLPEPLLLPSLRVGGSSWFVGEGACDWGNKVLSGSLICCKLSVNDVRQIRGQLIHLGSGTFPSLVLLGFVKGFWLPCWLLFVCFLRKIP